MHTVVAYAESQYQKDTGTSTDGMKTSMARAYDSRWPFVRRRSVYVRLRVRVVRSVFSILSVPRRPPSAYTRMLASCFSINHIARNRRRRRRRRRVYGFYPFQRFSFVVADRPRSRFDRDSRQIIITSFSPDDGWRLSNTLTALRANVRCVYVVITAMCVLFFVDDFAQKTNTVTCTFYAKSFQIFDPDRLYICKTPNYVNAV